ncbi:MAG TPA: hypothetical protein VF765_34705 [Polyangiaceae bacterium]
MARSQPLFYTNPMRTKAEVIAELQNMLRDIMSAASGGTSYARIARAHGYVDGYMRALLDLGIAEQKELVQIVAAERERSNGPAVRVLSADDDVVAA